MAPPRTKARILLSPAPPREEGEGPFNRLIIRGAILIDGTGAPPRGPMDIVIEGNRIVEIVDVGTPGVAGLDALTHFYGLFESLHRDADVQPWPVEVNYATTAPATTTGPRGMRWRGRISVSRDCCGVPQADRGGSSIRQTRPGGEVAGRDEKTRRSRSA